VIELTDWIGRTCWGSEPWLVLGKGPTFERRHEFDLGAFKTLALNHVVREQAVDASHIIDIDVVGDCADALVSNCKWLLMPRNPHLHSEKTDRLLEDWFDEYPVLRELDGDGRLVWYNLAGTRHVDRSPVIGAQGFSSHAALHILGAMGVHKVRTLGVDGGRSYADTFKPLEATTMLENGASSYDSQFRVLNSIAAEYDLDYAPLVEPLRIFVGTDETQIVAHRVLEYSIRKHSSIPIEFTPMLGFPHRMPRDQVNQPRTKFSFCRFMIPKLCDFQGRALYLDADMLVFGDIAELAAAPFDGHKILSSQPEHPEAWNEHGGKYLGARSAAVMLLDCSALPWDVDEIVGGLDEGRYTYEELMSDLCIVGPDDVADTISPAWNDLERYEPDVTKLLHFTIVPIQPWKNDDNPLRELWMQEYREAVEAGAVPAEEVEFMVDRGLAKQSLRGALRLAPSRRSTVANASLEIAEARHRITQLERRIDSMEHSLSWRLGSGIVRAVNAPKKLLKRRAVSR
jgi:glycosyl transferase family 8